MSTRPTHSAPLARSAMAYVLAGGRGTPPDGADGPARQARRLLRREVPHHRFRPVQRHQLRHPPHRRSRRSTRRTSLIRHMQRGWNFLRPERNETFDILPASQRVSRDGVVCRHRRRGLPEPRHHRELRPRATWSCSPATTSTRWITSAMLQQHVDPGADVTVGCIEVPRHGGERPSASCTSTPSDRIISFLEKPADPPCHARPAPTWRSPPWASTSSTRALLCGRAAPRRRAIPDRAATSARTSSPPSSPRGTRRRAPLRGLLRPLRRAKRKSYWRDVGTVDAYWQANIDLTDVVPALDLYDRDWPIWTNGEVTPPAKFVLDDDGRRGMAVDSLVSGGCIVSGSHRAPLAALLQCPRPFLRQVEGAVLLPGVDVGRHARLRQRGRRQRRPSCPTGSSSARTRSTTPRRFRRTRERRLPDHPADDRRPRGMIPA